ATRALLCPGSETIRGSGMLRLQSYRSMKLVYNECTFGITFNNRVLRQIVVNARLGGNTEVFPLNQFHLPPDSISMMAVHKKYRPIIAIGIKNTI
ncbi:MAG TPA: hypothetical protein PLF49_07985, partial [Saprospiraceae bacterium]|nr:hypothetical protein [Saprospiraceae bacterium]